MYSRVFKNIKPKAVHLSRVAAPNIWTGAKRDRVLYARLWLSDMSRLYGIPVPSFRFVNDQALYDASGGGEYVPLDHLIVLYRWSFVTLAHEFRHAMQACGVVDSLYRGDHEQDARAWSVSLFRCACPLSYKRAAQSGRLHFL